MCSGKDLKIAAKIRACLSRAIATGVTATVNDEMRRMQLATLNAVAFSMVPPAPDRCARGSAPTGPKPPRTACPRISSNSLLSMHNKFNTIISRGDSSRPPAVADEPVAVKCFAAAVDGGGI